MSHAEQIHFFKLVFEIFPSIFSKKVLDIGSLEINGGPHRLLKAQEYIGVDIASGPNISLVSAGEEVSLPTGYFDASISSECFEHNPNWRATLHNMIRMTKNGGAVVFSCASTYRPEHGTSRSDGGRAAPLAVQSGKEYYRNVTRRDVVRCLDASLFDRRFLFRNYVSKDLYFIGLKYGSVESDRNTFDHFVVNYSRYLKTAGSRRRAVFFDSLLVCNKFVSYILPKPLKQQIKLILKKK
jgi:SAM-dependent methyltransferase